MIGNNSGGADLDNGAGKSDPGRERIWAETPGGSEGRPGPTPDTNEKILQSPWEDDDFARLSGMISATPRWKSSTIAGASGSGHASDGPSAYSIHAKSGPSGPSGRQGPRLWLPLLLSTGGALVIGTMIFSPLRDALRNNAQPATHGASAKASGNTQSPEMAIRAPQAVLPAALPPVSLAPAMAKPQPAASIAPVKAVEPSSRREAGYPRKAARDDEVADGTIAVGDLVADVQSRLSALSYAIGEVNGRLNTVTQNAIKQFQAREGLPSTGMIDAGLLMKLKNAKPPGMSDVAQPNLISR